MRYRRLSAPARFNKLTLLISAADKAKITGDYILLDKNTLSASDYAGYVKTYPDLANEPVYKLNTSDKAEITQLDSILSKTIPVVATIETSGAAVFAGTGLQIPPGTDPFTVIAQLPPDQLAQVQSVVSATTGVRVGHSAEAVLYGLYFE